MGLSDLGPAQDHPEILLLAKLMQWCMLDTYQQTKTYAKQG